MIMHKLNNYTSRIRLKDISLYNLPLRKEVIVNFHRLSCQQLFKQLNSIRLIETAVLLNR